MRLTISTPLKVIADVEQVAHVRAEDDTGAFGILPGRADFLTALRVSVVTWRDLAGAEHHAAVRGGVFEVRGGSSVTITTREAITDDDLPRLQTQVLSAFRHRTEQEQTAKADSQRLHVAAIRQICRLLQPKPSSALPGGPQT